MSASEALALDGQHGKSLLRRAKATFRGIEYDNYGINPFVLSQVEEDLGRLIRMNGQGAEEALQMKETIHQAVEQQLANVGR